MGTFTKTKRYKDALAWARNLRVPGQPLEFPTGEQYVRMVAEHADIDLNHFDDFEAALRDLPEEFELAYLEVKLERLRDAQEKQ